MGAPKIKRTIRQSRKEHRSLFGRFRRGEVSYVAIAQDSTGKILAVGANYQSAVNRLEKLGLHEQPYDIRDFEVNP